MDIFSDFLICCDYDRTMTAPDGSIPQRNLDAIRYFMENGGAFSMNTGRSTTFFQLPARTIPVNAPTLLFNGAVAYDYETKRTAFVHSIQASLVETMEAIEAKFPELVVEIQGLDAHYLSRPNDLWEGFIVDCGGVARICPWNQVPMPFVKLCVYAPMIDYTVSQFFRPDPALIARMDQVEQWLKAYFHGTLAVERSAPLIVDASAAGTGKGTAARQLARQLGRKTLVCIGDAKNDLSMLTEADLPFVPADASLAACFPNVCPCGEGAVADVIEKLEKMK